ncbi:MAG: hypothetical protein Q9187_001270 [Circinaria calcarea]
MAVEAPDPKTFSSWEDAFQYPVPTVRRMEQQLRNDIAGNREKLRTLVGASYRELLGTAETIIAMDGQMHEVETYLGDVGRKCNMRLLEKSGSNLRLLEGQSRMRDREHYRFASQLAVLRKCPEVISRLLRKGGSVLVAAKVLVISRLLHKKISENQKTHTYVEAIRTRLARLRQKLLASIDRRFKTLLIESTSLVDAMCAYSIANSSSTTDILRHFHRIRSEAIFAHMQKRDDGGGNVLQALKLWIRTLQDTQAIFPRQLSDALSDLKAAPFFNSPDVRSIVEMDHDVHDEWIGEDIKNFTPYIRHDDLQVETANQQLTQWASTTLGKYRDIIHDLLGSMDDPNFIVQLRRRTIELWFSSHSQAAGIDRPQVLNSLRETFTTRLTCLIADRCSILSQVTSTLTRTLHEWQPGVSGVSPFMFDDSVIYMDTSNGARPFIEALRTRVYGSNDQIKEILQGCQTWLDTVHAFETLIQGLRKLRWEEDPDDVDEDDDFFDQRNTLLSETDPQTLSDALASAVTEALSTMRTTIDQMAANLTKDRDGALKSVFLLRILREFNQRIPPSMEIPNISPSSIQTLQHIIATSVIQTSLPKSRGRIAKAMKRDRLPQRALWEGTPELPTMPSCWAFRLLHVLVKEMLHAGRDIWSPPAVGHLKVLLRGALVEVFSAPSNAHSVGDSPAAADGNDGPDDDDDHHSQPTPPDHLPNGQTPPSPESSSPSPFPSPSPSAEREDCQIQEAFDLAYLDHATLLVVGKADHAGTTDAFARLRHARLQHHPGLPVESRARVNTAVAEYWRRTTLLFGLLA